MVLADHRIGPCGGRIARASQRPLGYGSGRKVMSLNSERLLLTLERLATGRRRPHERIKPHY